MLDTSEERVLEGIQWRTNRSIIIDIANAPGATLPSPEPFLSCSLASCTSRPIILLQHAALRDHPHPESE
jgi:hypothetical protein